MIRIEGPDGRQAYFVATHQDAAGVLRALESTPKGLRFKAIAAHLASDGLNSPAPRIRNVLMRLEQIGIARRKEIGLYSRATGYTVTALEDSYAPRRLSPRRAQTEAELRKLPKIRIAGPRGRTAHFGRAQGLALSVLCLLEPAGRRMSTQAIVARLAECRVHEVAGHIREVVRELRRIGVVRRRPVCQWELCSAYVISVVGPKRRSGIDWMQNDRELARRLDLSRERIRQLRRDAGAAVSPFKGLRSSTVAFRLWLRENRERAGALTAEQIMAEIGVRLGRQNILDGMQAAGVDWKGRLKCTSSLHPLTVGKRFNPDLPIRDLVEIWGLTPSRFAQLRVRPDFGPPRWDARLIRKTQGTPEYEEYRRAVEDERRKATAYRAARVPQESSSRTLWARWGPPARPKYWLHCNWALPTKDIAAIWGLTPNQIYVWRLRGQHGPPQWDRRSVRAKQGTAEFEEYRRALEAERGKVEALHKEQPQGPQAADCGDGVSEAQISSTSEAVARLASHDPHGRMPGR